MKNKIKEFYHQSLKDFQKVNRKKAKKKIFGHQERKKISKTISTTSMEEIINICHQVNNNQK